jgi:hypothetical protein
MPLRRLRFTTWQLITAVAVLAVVCRFGGAVVHHPSPRTSLPPLVTLYLTWVCCDGLGFICVTPILARPTKCVALTVLALLAVAGLAAESRWTDFLERSRYHSGQADLCRRSSEGQLGPLICCGEGRCIVVHIPQAQSQEERAEMARNADYHARLADYYQSRW